MEEGKIQEEARIHAKDLLSEFYLTGTYSNITWDNPYRENTQEAEDYDMYMEHYIMTGLGY